LIDRIKSLFQGDLIMRTPAENRPTDTHRYPVSLQQAAAAIFGVALIDGDENRKMPSPRERQQQQG
jgi:hypothetical protein